MRAVWSFWSKPFHAFKGRIWQTPLHHLLSWGLSVQLASKHYPETVLVTDKAGKALLVDRLGLSFTHVSTELERLRKVDVGWWAVGKIVAYSLQTESFVHLDNDVFLWKPLPQRLVQSPVFSQCPENFHTAEEWSGPAHVERAFAQHGLTLPAEWEWSRSHGGDRFREDNCGIVGGTRTDFLRYFANLALDVVMNPQNAPAWARLPEKEGYNMIVEQFLLGACLDYHRFHPDSPYRGISMRYLFPSFEQSFDEQNAARAGFTHLLGDAKSHPYIAGRLEERIKSADSAFYRHCVQLIQRQQASASYA
jgi:hypothetical protein